ncbi:hypothetical protein K438DRAFT_1749039 [Mycena galopus ATCC 62051]|nr:hypothetical protein K438DRAFT_1749039 [Mycena galopus ATCC 62051]
MIWMRPSAMFGKTTEIPPPYPARLDPPYPHLALLIQFRNSKARRGLMAYFQKFFMLLEPVGRCPTCIVTSFLYMALTDDTFSDITHIDQIMVPEFPLVGVHTLTMKDSVLSQPVFRAEVVKDSVYVISPDKALQAGCHQRQLTLVSNRLGYKAHITMYNWRRGAGKTFARCLKETNHQALMSHLSSRTYTSTMGMNVGSDPEAPTRLDLIEIATLDRLDDLVQRRITKQKCRTQAEGLAQQLKLLDPDDSALEEERASFYGKLRTAVLKLQKLNAEYATLYHGEMKTCVIVSIGKENDDGISTSNVALVTNITDPHAALFDILYHSAESHLSCEVTSTVNMYLALPARRFAMCYPGEYPTADEKCPGCGIDCRHGTFQGKGSIGCKPKTTFPTCAEFIVHVRDHIDTIGPRGCRWCLEGTACGDNNDDQDWACHFAQVHDINVSPEVAVNYCILCLELHIDALGHVEGEVDLTPIGIEFMDPWDNAVDYQNDLGFDGAHPEFHPEFHCQVVDGVPLTPMYCACGHYMSHIQTHDKEIEEEDNMCPVPSCGTHKFNRFELEMHLVAFHCLPLHSSGQQALFWHLKLPLPPKAAPTVNLAHSDDAMEVDEAAAPPTVKLTKAALLVIASRERRQRRDSANAGSQGTTDNTAGIPKGHWCTSCHNQVDNILDHVDVCTFPMRSTHFHLLTCENLGRVNTSEILARLESNAQGPVALSSKSQQQEPVALSSKKQNSDEDSEEDEVYGSPAAKLRCLDQGPADVSQSSFDREEGQSSRKRVCSQAMIHLGQCPNPADLPGYLCNGYSREFTVAELDLHFSTLCKASTCGTFQHRLRNPEGAISEKWSKGLETWKDVDE